MIINGFQKKIILGLGCAIASGSASYGGGYAVKLMSAYSNGMANAGSGVIDDPIASFINPAAMILNNTHQGAIQTSGAFPHTRFRGTGRLALGGGRLVLLNKTAKVGNAAESVAIPSGGFVAKIHDRIRLGIAVTAPYGLGFDYGHNSPTQYYLINTKMQTVNITPSLAVRAFDWLTLGAGFQAQWTKVILKKRKILNASPLVTGIANVEGDEWSYGWTAGILVQPTKEWNIGFSYRSKLDPDLDGTFKSPIRNAKAHAKVHFPHTFTLSTSLQLSPQWTLYMDAIRTLWYSTRNITIRVKTATGTSRDITPQYWRSTWFLSGGLNYKWNDCWAFRAGLGYDKTPTKDSTRVPAIPDANKLWLACGTTYTYKKFSTTLSYGHEFFKKARINLNLPASGTLVGTTKTHIDIVSLQFNMKI